MIVEIKDVISSEELKIILNSLESAEFVDGKITAGWHAKLVKDNTQLDKKSQKAVELSNIVINALNRHPLVQAAALPKQIHSLLFSRYQEGMSYGSHVDNAFMGKPHFWRSDVSFTLFLSSPTSYDGGELVIEGATKEDSYKLEAGSAILYPSSSLHRVGAIASGTRLVAVGWIQSLIRDPAKRELLFDLDTVRRSIFAKEGKSLEFDLLCKTYSNLLRIWGE